MRLREVLIEHVGHRLSLVEPAAGKLSLKCFSCSGRLVDLAKVLDRPIAIGLEAPRDPAPAETCKRHPGEFQHSCRPCASETKARKPDDPPPVSQVRNGADPATVPEVAAAKARLAELARTRELRTRQQQPPVSPPSGTVDATAAAEGGA